MLTGVIMYRFCGGPVAAVSSGPQWPCSDQRTPFDLLLSNLWLLQLSVSPSLMDPEPVCVFWGWGWGVDTDAYFCQALIFNFLAYFYFTLWGTWSVTLMTVT